MNFRSYISILIISKYIKICKPTYFQHSTCKVPQQHKVSNDQSLVCSMDIMACIGNTCASHVVVVMTARMTRKRGLALKKEPYGSNKESHYSMCTLFKSLLTLEN